MFRLGMVLLAVAVAIVTTVVPARLAARQTQPESVAARLLAAHEAPDAQNGAMPAKRCQNGAGLLGCAFEVPKAAGVVARTVMATVRFEATVAKLAGRAVPASLRPPRPRSA